MTAPTTAPTKAGVPVGETPDPVEEVEVVELDLLVEDVSIDGMCGVY